MPYPIRVLFWGGAGIRLPRGGFATPEESGCPDRIYSVDDVCRVAGEPCLQIINRGDHEAGPRCALRPTRYAA